MSMQSTTIKILEAANFSPPQALALADAIECQIKGAERVTAPVLDLRVAAIEGFNKLVTLGLTTTGTIITAVFLIVVRLTK